MDRYNVYSPLMSQTLIFILTNVLITITGFLFKSNIEQIIMSSQESEDREESEMISF